MNVQIQYQLNQNLSKFTVEMDQLILKFIFSHSVMSNSLRPRGLQPTRLLCSQNSPGKNIGVSCYFLLQAIFSAQRSNPGLLHCKQILYSLSHKGGPGGLEKWERMGKTRNLFKKIRDTKGTFHVKQGTVKDRNGMDLTGAEDIKRRWQEYTEELYKKRSSQQS